MADSSLNSRAATEQLEREALYIHPSENSSLTLASSPLDGTNFLTWSRSVYVALGTKMKLGFIDGTLPRPDTGSTTFEQWRRVDLLVTSWIWNSISRDIVESFMFVNSSRELWLEIQSRYGRSNGPMIYRIQREISTIAQHDLSLTAYVTKLKKFWNELLSLAPNPRCTCGCCTCDVNKAIEERNEHVQLMQFLMGLHEIFDHERSQLLMQDPLPTLERAFAMLFTVENQRQVNTEVGALPQQMAYQFTSKDGRNSGDRFQNKKRTYVDRRTLSCTHCHKTGHTSDTCFQIYGVPDWYKVLNEKKKKGLGVKPFAAAVSEQDTSAETSSAKQMTDLMADLIKLMQKNNVARDPITAYSNFVCNDDVEFAGNFSGSSEIDLNCWIIDTGATNHICANIKLFDSFTAPSTPKLIHLPDGTYKIATYIGTVHLNKHITLTQVLYLPSFSVNLLSVSQLCRNTPLKFHFTDSSCILQDQHNRANLIEGNRCKNLYIVRHSTQNTSFSTSVSCNAANNRCNVQTWHHRLGHIPLLVMRHIPFLNSAAMILDDSCETCHKAKQTRSIFPSSTSHSKAPFDLIHLDVWGPYTTQTISNCSYILTILDDHSRSLWTFLLKQKSQVVSVLKSFVSMVKTQFSRKIKVIRSDNGSEFLNNNCQTFCLEMGILHQTSCTYSPQQNGRIERKHRQLLNVARALLFQASLPLKFWGDSILTATYLINRTPSKILQWKSPFELLTGTSPTYHHLRIFGSLCYATNVDPHKTKFHPRARKCILLGYAMSQKGYKLFDIDNNRTLVSRDVQFYEHIFPFSASVSQEQPSPCPLPVTSPFIDTSVPAQIEPVTVSPLPEPSSSTSNSPPLHNSPPRRSARISKRPTWLNDFVCSAHHPTSLHSNNPAYVSFVASLSVLQEPNSFSEAVQHKEWKEAMDFELQALEANNTWKVSPLPPSKRAIGCKWVFKTKLRADGTVDRYKARLVAKGFNQIEGIDYTESFSPVAKSVTVRLFLAIAAAHSWPIQQLDINNAFLHGYLEEDIYMVPPEGYEVPPNMVCKLQRSLYGLKQASRQWNAEFTLKLTAYGFVQSVHDHCLFVKPSSSGIMALIVYVDDILITGPSIDDIARVKCYLHDLFTIKDLGDARYFLGLEIARSSSGLYIAQTKYTLDIVRDTGLLHAKPASSPFPPGLKLAAASGTLFSNPGSYRRLVGRLLYLGFSRPDISYSVQQLSQYLNQPCDSHWKAALHVVRYLKGCPAKGLYFPAASSFNLRAFCDADWASCLDSRRSLTGYCVFLGDALVSWKTKKQSTVSRSTAESEYRSLASTVCELRWISYILSDFNVPYSLPVELFCDNKAALHIVANPVFHERTKHIELDCHLVRDAYKDGFISPSFVPGVLQLADVFTKSLPLRSFLSLISKLGLVSFDPSPTCGGAIGVSHHLHHQSKFQQQQQLQHLDENEADVEELLDTG
ncbi:UNVERIFIED_CONTAM: Retrovirus-related Pol polyprotein from transposon RE2 [Sesamum indicum]